MNTSWQFPSPSLSALFVRLCLSGFLSVSLRNSFPHCADNNLHRKKKKEKNTPKKARRPWSQIAASSLFKGVLSGRLGYQNRERLQGTLLIHWLPRSTFRLVLNFRAKRRLLSSVPQLKIFSKFGEKKRFKQNKALACLCNLETMGSTESYFNLESFLPFAPFSLFNIIFCCCFFYLEVGGGGIRSS